MSAESSCNLSLGVNSTQGGRGKGVCRYHNSVTDPFPGSTRLHAHLGPLPLLGFLPETLLPHLTWQTPTCRLPLICNVPSSEEISWSPAASKTCLTHEPLPQHHCFPWWHLKLGTASWGCDNLLCAWGHCLARMQMVAVQRLLLSEGASHFTGAQCRPNSTGVEKKSQDRTGTMQPVQSSQDGSIPRTQGQVLESRWVRPIRSHYKA